MFLLARLGLNMKPPCSVALLPTFASEQGEIKPQGPMQTLGETAKLLDFIPIMQELLMFALIWEDHSSFNPAFEGHRVGCSEGGGKNICVFFTAFTSPWMLISSLLWQGRLWKFRFKALFLGCLAPSSQFFGKISPKIRSSPWGHRRVQEVPAWNGGGRTTIGSRSSRGATWWWGIRWWIRWWGRRTWVWGWNKERFL